MFMFLSKLRLKFNSRQSEEGINFGQNIRAMVPMRGGSCQAEREEVAPSGHVTTMMPTTLSY